MQLAAQVGRELFPPEEAALIADVIERDLPYYDASGHRSRSRRPQRFFAQGRVAQG